MKKTAREYKRRSEVSTEELRLGFRSDGSDLGTDQASYGSALGLAKAQHVEQKL